MKPHKPTNHASKRHGTASTRETRLSGTSNRPAGPCGRNPFTETDKPAMKSKGLLLLLALLLVLPSGHTSLQNVTETIQKSFKMAFSALNTETFAASAGTSAYAAGPGMEISIFEDMPMFEGMVVFEDMSMFEGKNLFEGITMPEGLPIFEGMAMFEGAATYFSEDREIVLPLSRPGEPGRLNVNIMRGSVEISGYDGDEVIVRYDSRSMSGRERQDPPEGMRRISGSIPGFQATEDDNVVEIRSEALMGQSRFQIQVPRNFSINTKLMQAQEIVVSNVSGDLEIGVVSGEVTLTDVSGAAVVSTVNGNIKGVFTNVPADKPMSFKTLTGDIDLSFPAGSRFTTRLRSEFGDMFTDFDMDIREDATRRRDNANGLRLSVNETVVGDVNGGGPEYTITTLRGNIYLRKN